MSRRTSWKLLAFSQGAAPAEKVVAKEGLREPTISSENRGLGANSVLLVAR